MKPARLFHFRPALPAILALGFLVFVNGCTDPAEMDPALASVYALPSDLEDNDGLSDGVYGSGLNAGNTESVLSLGHNVDADNYVVVHWNGDAVTNEAGVDFAIFENPFRIGESPDYFMDPAVISLSRDAQTWVPFPHDYTAPDETVYSPNPEHWEGFAGTRPVLLNRDDNPVDPFDTVLAGGDPFDLDDLPTDGAAGEIRRDGFLYLKITSAASLENPDTGSRYPADAISNGPDIDGVIARYLNHMSVK